MATCAQCGHLLGDGRFCTQCGARVESPEATQIRRPEPAFAGAAFGGPTTPPPSSARYPLFAEPAQSDGLAETAVRPLASRPSGAEAPVLGASTPSETLTARLVSEAKRWFATADPTWAIVFALGVGAMVLVFLLGMVLLLH